MAIHRYQSSYNGIIFNRQLAVAGEGLYGPDDERRLDPAYSQSDYRLDSCDLTRVTVEDFRELRQFLEGAEANESYEGVLIATGRGTIHASSPQDLEDKYWAMRAAFSPAVVRQAAIATDPVGVLPYDFKVDTAGPAISARRLYARPVIGRPVIVGRMREGLSRRFLWQLISMDPCVYAQELKQQQLLAGGNAVNAGTFYTAPKIYITFSGAGHAALTITNTTTGKAFVLDATAATNGAVWVIDVRRGTLTSGGGVTNRYSKRVSGYISAMLLQPGINAIAHANTAGVTNIRYDFRDAWA